MARPPVPSRMSKLQSTAMSPSRRLAVAASVVAVVLAAPLVVLVPPGEAPDEPAHLAYVDHVVRTGTLPAPRRFRGPFTYEVYQPPLAYLAMAATVRLAGHDGVAYPFVRDPGFRFVGDGTRAFLVPPDSQAVLEARGAVRAARAANLLWGALCSALTVLLCLRLAGSVWTGVAAAAPFALAPQLLLAAATANNDAMLAAGAAAALLGLVVVLEEEARPPVAAGASVAAGVAFGVKVSASALAPAVGVAAIVLARRRRWRSFAALVTPGLVLAAGFAWLSMTRTGGVLPSLPSGWGGATAGSLSRLLAEPWWAVQVWAGFWAKLGWFNLPLPRLAYVAFVAPTLLAGVGAATLLVRARRSWVVALLVGTVTANLGLLVLYMVRVDWQPQGRYLLPSLPALAGLAAVGLDALYTRSRGRLPLRAITVASVSVAFGIALLALQVVAGNYAS